MTDKPFQHEEKSQAGTKTKETEVSVFMRKNMNIGSVNQHLKVLVSMEGRSSKREEIAVFVLGSLKKYLENDHARLMPIFMADDGTSDLIKYLSSLDYKAHEYLSHTVALDCIRRIFSSPFGRKSLIKRKELYSIMSKSLLCDNIQAKVFVLEMFATMVQLPECRDFVIDSITDLHKESDEPMFNILVSQLSRTYGYHKIYWELRLAILSFINCYIKSYYGQDNKKKRISIRESLTEIGFETIIKKLEAFDHPKVMRHIAHYKTGNDVDSGINNDQEHSTMYEISTKPTIKEFNIIESTLEQKSAKSGLSVRIKGEIDISRPKLGEDIKLNKIDSVDEPIVNSSGSLLPPPPPPPPIGGVIDGFFFGSNQ